MKVCTDSCIFGAYVSVKNANHILDIGTGTGLLALMLSQRSEASMDAIEIDPIAAEQAKENVINSPWRNRIHVLTMSIQEYQVSANKKYDLVISNPPFYSNSLKSEKEKINLAYHSTSLNMKELVASVVSLLNTEGKFAVLLPPFESGLIRDVCASSGLYAEDILHIRDHDQSGVLREITTFSFIEKSITSKELIIKKEGQYSEAFINLLKPYYLNL